MDWKILGALVGFVLTIVVSVGGGAWLIADTIHTSELRTAVRIDTRIDRVEVSLDAVRSDLSKLRAEVEFIKGRL